MKDITLKQLWDWTGFNPLGRALVIDQIGEWLREAFFTDDGFGCYSNFELRPQVERLPDQFDADLDVTWTVARLGRVTMRYYWDGDGYLSFWLPGGVLVNKDCKTDYGWEWE